MAITTLDGVKNGLRRPVLFDKVATPTLVVQRPHSLFYLAGYPTNAAAPTPGISGAALTSYTGQLPFYNPDNVSAYIAQFMAKSSATAGTLLICDRLWHNSGITITSTAAQTINSVQFPPRDNNGTSDGEGVLVGVEVSTATGSGTPTLTLGYTNSEGTSGRTATNIQATVASSAIGAFYEIGLASGDTGVRSIQTFQLSTTWTSGTIHLVAYRILSEVIINSSYKNTKVVDILLSGFPRLYPNTVPFLIFVPLATTATIISGNIIYAHG